MILGTGGVDAFQPLVVWWPPDTLLVAGGRHDEVAGLVLGLGGGEERVIHDEARYRQGVLQGRHGRICSKPNNFFVYYC